MFDYLDTITSKEFMDQYGEDVTMYLVNKKFDFNNPCEYIGEDTIWLTDDLVAHKDYE